MEISRIEVGLSGVQSVKTRIAFWFKKPEKGPVQFQSVNQLPWELTLVKPPGAKLSDEDEEVLKQLLPAPFDQHRFLHGCLAEHYREEAWHLIQKGDNAYSEAVQGISFESCFSKIMKLNYKPDECIVEGHFKFAGVDSYFRYRFQPEKESSPIFADASSKHLATPV